jgi:repressor LexA
MSIQERLKAYIKHKGLSVRAFEERAKLSNNYVGNIRKSISDDKLVQITTAFPDLNPAWIRMGMGEMLIGGTEAPNVVKEPTGDYNFSSRSAIPLISVEAIAGVASGDVQSMSYESQMFVIPPFAGSDFLIPVRGDSMAPRYHHGDLVACKHVAIDSYFRWEKVYVLDTEQGPLIKRVGEGSDDNHVLLVSENILYKPQQMHKRFIRSLAIVLGLVRVE